MKWAFHCHFSFTRRDQPEWFRQSEAHDRRLPLVRMWKWQTARLERVSEIVHGNFSLRWTLMFITFRAFIYLEGGAAEVLALLHREWDVTLALWKNVSLPRLVNVWGTILPSVDQKASMETIYIRFLPLNVTEPKHICTYAHRKKTRAHFAQELIALLYSVGVACCGSF